MLSWLVSVAGKVISENTPQPFSQSVITLTEDLFAVHMVFVPKLNWILKVLSRPGIITPSGQNGTGPQSSCGIWA